MLVNSAILPPCLLYSIFQAHIYITRFCFTHKVLVLLILLDLCYYIFNATVAWVYYIPVKIKTKRTKRKLCVCVYSQCGIGKDFKEDRKNKGFVIKFALCIVFKGKLNAKTTFSLINRLYVCVIMYSTYLCCYFDK